MVYNKKLQVRYKTDLYNLSYKFHYYLTIELPILLQIFICCENEA